MMVSHETEARFEVLPKLRTVELSACPRSNVSILNDLLTKSSAISAPPVGRDPYRLRNQGENLKQLVSLTISDHLLRFNDQQ